MKVEMSKRGQRNAEIYLHTLAGVDATVLVKVRKVHHQRSLYNLNLHRSPFNKLGSLINLVTKLQNLISLMKMTLKKNIQ